MKRIILLSAVIVFSLQSCKKEDPEYCWKCVTNTRYLMGGVLYSTDTNIHCGISQNNISDFEKEHYKKEEKDGETFETKMDCKIQ